MAALAIGASKQALGTYTTKIVNLATQLNTTNIFT